MSVEHRFLPFAETKQKAIEEQTIIIPVGLPVYNVIR